MKIKLKQKELEALAGGFIIPEHEVLRLLREKGAPVVGIIDLKPNPNYNWERYDDKQTGDLVFTITEKMRSKGI